MYLIFLDIEATGVNPEKHRTVDIAFKVIESASGRLITGYESIVFQPQDVWAEADPESLKFTGFTWEMVLQGKTEAVVAAEVALILNHAHVRRKRAVFVCQNPSFDRIFFNQIISVELQEEYYWPYHWLDLASMYWAIECYKDKQKAASITEAGLSKDRIGEHFGIPPETRPHRAINGVNHLIACYKAVLEMPWAS